MGSRPFTLRLFSPSGAPDGVLVASRDDWPGKAVIFPRDLVGEVKGRAEYSRPGVYILVGNKKMYVGEGDPVGSRIDSHVSRKDFWTKGVFFTAESGRINKAHIQHIEARLIALALANGRTPLDNANQPTVPALAEEEYASAENFLHDILSLLPLLGFRQFEVLDGAGVEAEEPDCAAIDEQEPVVETVGRRAELYLSLPQGLVFHLKSRKGASATLEIAEGGVRVKKDSVAAPDVSKRFELDTPSYAALRRQLIASGVLAVANEQLVFTQDQFFASGSAAAAVVRGAVSNSDFWKGPGNKTLGDYIREARASALVEED